MLAHKTYSSGSLPTRRIRTIGRFRLLYKMCLDQKILERAFMLYILDSNLFARALSGELPAAIFRSQEMLATAS
jgi:hypothetical protein